MKKELLTLLKRGLALILVLVLAIPPVPVRAEGITSGTSGAVTYSFNEVTGVLTLSGEGATAIYVAKADLEAATEWVALMPKVNELVVEEGVTLLGDRLFSLATALKKVTLPASLKSIGNRCFSDCEQLTEVIIPANSELETLGEVVFNGCLVLETIDLSNTKIKVLPKKTFAACPALTSITLPELSSAEGVTAIGESCFGATSGTSTSSLVRINYLGSKDSWTSISVHKTGNTQLKNKTLYCSDGVYSVKSTYDADTYSGTNAVAGYPLTWAVADGTLTLTGWGKMHDFDAGSAPWGKDFTSVVIDKSITAIGANAFAGCADLTENYTYAGNFETLKAASSQTGNEALFGSPIPSEPEVPEVVSGGIAWTFDETTGTLTISPAKNPEGEYASGVMRRDYTAKDKTDTNPNPDPVPWIDYIEEITALVVKPGVTELGNRVCQNAKKLTNVSLPDGLTYIGDRAFSDCAILATISLPDSLTSLGSTVFNGCFALTEVDLSNTKLTALGDKIFAACSGLKTLKLPGTVNSISANTFGSTKYSGKQVYPPLESLYFDGSLDNWTKIDNITSSTNKYLYNSTCAVYCADGTWVNDYTRAGNLCYKISNSTLTIRGIGAMPDYAEGAAPWGKDFTSVVIDKNITAIGDNAFYGCADLTGSYTYAGNFETLKANSSSTGNEALFSSTTPTDPSEPEEPAEAVSGGIAWTFDETTGTLTISPAKNPEKGYESGVMRTDYKNQAEGGVPWYNNRTDITSLVVTDGVKTLGNRVCQDAKNLTSVSLPDGLTTIGERAFSDCYALEEIKLPDSLTTLGEVAFNGCVKLTSVDLSKTKIENLARKAFAACPELVWISVPGSVTEINYECFGDTGLVNLDNKNHATGKLETLYFNGTIDAWLDMEYFGSKPDTVTNLTNGKCTVYCLNGIWNANYISADNFCYKISNGTLSIRGTGAMPDYAEGAAPWFDEAASITAIDFEDGVTAIGANAFDGFVNLETVNISNIIVSIGKSAFNDCEKLTKVGYLGTVSQWDALKENIADDNDPLLGATMTSGYSGECGDNATWSYDPETKTLTISGTGPMWDYDQNTFRNTPWSKFSAELEKIVIGYGITATGRYAFCYLDALKELEFETKNDRTTCEVIGGYCFCWNNTLETVVLPEGVRFLSGRAFSRVESVKTIYLPSTLESVDMYAFKSEDASITISNVYYNGTKEDFERNVYVSSQGDNDKFLLPDGDTTWHYQESTYYDDVPANSGAWYHDAVYYLKNKAMIPASGSFGVEVPADLQWVLNTLYVRAGSSGAYADALDWAKVMRIAAADAAKDQDVSLDALAEILYRTALYNGHSVDLGNGTALTWCDAKGYIHENVSTTGALTRAQAASVLVSFLKDEFGSADRYDQMRDEFKAAYQAGGDGKMYILALHHAGKGKVGDSTLILMPGGELMLIDTFRPDGWTKYLSATLEYLEVKDLDYLVLSHGHGDHDANLSNVVNYIYDAGYTVGNYWSAGDTTSTNEKNAIALLKDKGGVTIDSKLRTGDQRIIGEGANQVVADILWPTAAGASGDSNNGSLTMKLTYGDSSFITGGDLFMDGELAIVNHYKDNPQALRADVLKTNHHGSYSSDRFEWVHAIDPKVMFTHSDDTGDSAQCYQYSQEGRVWTSAGRDGGVLIVMDDEEDISVTTGYDTNMRHYLVSPCADGHDFSGHSWEFDETGHWHKCKHYYLCNAMDEVQEHNPVHSADGNVITVSCDVCKAVISTTTLDENTSLELNGSELVGEIELPLGITLTTDQNLEDQIIVSENDHLIVEKTDGGYSYTVVDTEIVTSNMELGNEFTLFFWLPESDLSTDVSEYHAEIRRLGAEDEDPIIVNGEDWKKINYDLDQDSTKEDFYQIPYSGLAAKEMADTLIIQVFNDQTAQSDTFTDSLRTNAETLIKNFADSQDEHAQELVASMIDMLNYGAAAQLAFGYNTDNLANSALSEDQKKVPAADTDKMSDNWESCNGIGYGSNLELKENIILHIWFKAANVEYAVVTYTDHNGNEIKSEKITNFTDRISNSVKSIAIDTLVVADGFEEVTVKFFDAQDNNLGVVKESIESYLKYMLEKDSDSAPLYNAIAKFITSSYNYFH